MAKKLLQIDFRAKIILVMLPITLLVFAALGYYIYINQAAAYEADGIFRSQEYVKTYANEMSKEFGIYMETAKNLNNTCAAFQDIDINSRRNYYISYIESLLRKSPHIVACWVDFDRNALDGRDDQFRGVGIWPATGRCFLLNYHNDAGSPTFQPPNPKDPVEGWLGDEWLKAPRDLKKLIMTEPFYWSYTNNTAHMQLVSTIAVPVFNKQGQVVGASGTDIPLHFLVEYFEKIKPFGDGYAMLYSNQGQCLAHPNTELLDKDILANPIFPKDVATEVERKMKSKQDFYVDFNDTKTGERLLAFFYPLAVPNTDAVMMTSIVVPYESMIAHAEAAISLIVGSFGIGILLIAVLIISVVSGLTAPLRRLFKFTSDYLVRISKGDIPEQIDESKYSADFLAIINSLNAAGNAIESLTHTTQHLLNQALGGDLHARIDASQFQGDYKKLMDGVNQLVNAFAEPLAIVCSFMKGLAAGDTNVQTFTKQYKGDFATLANAVNATNATLDIILSEIMLIAQHAEAGQLSARADISKVQGAWRNILESLNTIVGSADTIIIDSNKVLGQMATGDLTPRITNTYRGDFKDMQDSINNLGESLTALVSQLQDAVHTTASASAEISATAESLSVSTQEQSSQADEVATAMEAMARTVADNARSVTRTASVAKQSGDIAKTGGEVVEQTVVKMKQIAAVVKISSENMVKLGQSSQKIGEIISVIDDIADQTNLLSLNAAIEAARAGEQGRGFAVVADSVGKLAVSTAGATKEIADMIKGIQHDTEAAVTAMTQGESEVQSGIELADNAGQSIQDILSGINELLDMINTIAAASEEQSSSSEQISRNVSSISKVTADSAHNIEDVATTANDLARMTETLTSLVSNFKIGTTASSVESHILH